MSELWFIPIIGILGLISSIVSSKGSLYDKRFKWYKRLTIRGKIVSGVGLLIMVLSIWQFITVKKEDKKKDSKQAREQFISDSVITSEIKKGVDSNRRQLFSDLSVALAKQNLRLDTVTKNIKSLADSQKTIVYSSPKDIPMIIVKDNGISISRQKDSLIDYSIQMFSTQAASKLKFINYLCEVNFVDGTKSITKFTRLTGSMDIPKDLPFSKGFFIISYKDVMSIKIALIGKYSRDDGTGDFHIENVYEYRFASKITSILEDEDRNEFFKTYHLK